VAIGFVRTEETYRSKIGRWCSFFIRRDYPYRYVPDLPQSTAHVRAFQTCRSRNAARDCWRAAGRARVFERSGSVSIEIGGIRPPSALSWIS
jgi:hypothetical protein